MSLAANQPSLLMWTRNLEIVISKSECLCVRNGSRLCFWQIKGRACLCTTSGSRLCLNWLRSLDFFFVVNLTCTGEAYWFTKIRRDSFSRMARAMAFANFYKKFLLAAFQLLCQCHRCHNSPLFHCHFQTQWSLPLSYFHLNHFPMKTAGVYLYPNFHF